MSTPASSFPNFKEAYCAVHGCTPERFTGHLLRRSVPPLFRPLAALTYQLNPSLFVAEIDVIAQMGRSASGREIGSAISELDGLRRVERSFWRGIGLRANGDRLLDAWAEVKSLIAKQDDSAIPDTTLIAPSAPSASGDTPVAEPQRDRPAVQRGKLRQLHTEITSGRNMSSVLSEMGMTEAELMEMLEKNSDGNAPIAWLHRQLKSSQRVAELEAENRGLMKLLSQAGLKGEPAASGSARTPTAPH